ncbi:alpha,alpha-trehalose-phosphate synthase (UDP-forming) [Egicoccus halophilus]|uniref:Trehalose-6-phosphate synthase n=1 Tax=Egicoccus halophilus TaxID=1670830 RepID=A0A8J3AC85_9ACTN|nr:trehalose-6-phosphate synthase [Egicoccus halophilus]GGI08358.1 trehalose-6-phosphate synthase [Egicoccus halophilus]
MTAPQLLDEVRRRPLVVVANRLPVTQTEDGWEASAGGLVTALRPVIAETGGAWIGWDDDADAVPRRVEGLHADLHAVSLTAEEVAGHYHGFSNRTLWPLFHDAVVQPVIDRSWWQAYQEVNRRFAEVAHRVIADADEPPLLWVQDYHLLLLPDLLRRLSPQSPIGLFLHVPFPPPELMARLPWRDQLLQGMLAADSIGFHTTRYRDNFVRSVQQLFTGITSLGDTLALPDGRYVQTVAHPISIDTEEFSDLANDPETERELAELREQFAGRKVFLGVDRLDYTKGIRHRLQSIELLLEEHPELRGEIAFVQIAVPSRDDVEEYRDLRTQVETEVGRINGRFTEPGSDVPVHYLYRGVPRTRLAAYYRLADVMCITPLKDGMNLVAKEFVTVQAAAGEAGTLLLSEFTGAAQEFEQDAVRCNPFDSEGTSHLMAAALQLDEGDRRQRIGRMAEAVRSCDVFRWVDDELSDIARGHASP